jgi:hypothetical protein
LDQQIHAAIVLSDELKVASGVEDLTLKHDHGDDEAVQDLHPKIGPIDHQAVGMVSQALGVDEVLVAEQAVFIFSCDPYFPDSNHS